MKELLYSSLDIAAIINSMELGCQQESKMLAAIYQHEKDYLEPVYKDDMRKLALDVKYWLQYFYNKPAIDKEFPAIQKDFGALNVEVDPGRFTSDFTDLDLFFKSARLRILYGGGHDYVRIKLRTLLKQYGYKRRSKQLVERINKCIWFYHFETFVRGGEAISIEEADIDQMLTFRVL